MLLEFPNPKDPQDAEVAKMMLENPEGFARRAHEWAIRHANAPSGEFDTSKYRKEPSPKPKETSDEDYKGYNKELVDRFVRMGFAIDAVVEALVFVGIVWSAFFSSASFSRLCSAAYACLSISIAS